MPFTVHATWDDVPHLSEEQKKRLWESFPEHERDARAKGIPMLGAGRIFPYPEDHVFIEPFDLPAWWPRAYGFDADWNRTAACWGAWDRESDTVYVYTEHFMREQPPAVNAAGIRARGEWIPGAVDPSINGKISPKDGSRLVDEYVALGLDLTLADNTVEAGIFALQQRMSAGKLKIFLTCRNLLREYRMYRRADNGRPVKENDDLVDCLRYLIMTGMRIARTEPRDDMQEAYRNSARSRNTVTGY